nr:T5orf172 domain protein [Kaumoebavirus]
MSGKIYLLTSAFHKAHNLYKIGYHSGAQDALIKRYNTYVPKLEVTYFEEGTRKIENEVLKIMRKERIKNSNGGLTEWVKANPRQLVEVIEIVRMRQSDS